MGAESAMARSASARWEPSGVYPGPASVALLDTMGKLAEERLGREEMAIDCYRRAIKADPKHSPSLEALATILRERERWPPPEAPTVLMPPGLRHALSLPGTENQVGRPGPREDPVDISWNCIPIHAMSDLTAPPSSSPRSLLPVRPASRQPGV